MRKKRDPEVKIAAEFVAYGTHAQKQEHPWHVSISYRGDPNNENSNFADDFCGGSLISKQAILTGTISYSL
jgi:Trypsin